MNRSSAKETQAPASTEAASETAAASETTGETEASDAASGDLTHVNVAYMANFASLWQVATAINKGYFKDEGLDVQLYMFQDGPTEIASMESGSIDVAYIGPGAHKLCIKGQADIFCFSQLGNADCVMGLKSHGVNSLEDLKGKKVAYASGTSSGHDRRRHAPCQHRCGSAERCAAAAHAPDLRQRPCG